MADVGGRARVELKSDLCGEPELSNDLKDAANRKRKFRRDGPAGAAYRPQTRNIVTVRI
jgi:hypothetical protein